MFLDLKRSRVLHFSSCAVLLITLAAPCLNGFGAGEEPGNGSLTIGKMADGQLELFRVEQNGVLRCRWRKPSNGDWSSWTSLGGPVFTGVAAITDADGQMTVFAVNETNQSLQFIRQQTTTNSALWTTWQNLGGKIESPVCVARDADGRLDVFAVDAETGTAKHLSGSRAGWSAREDLGAALAPGLAVARNKDGRLDLFGIRASDKAVIHCWQLGTNAASGWSQWSSLGGPILPGFAIGQNSAGRLEVFAISAKNGSVIRACQTNANDSADWTSWEGFGGHAKPGLVVGQCGDKRIEVFAVNADDSMLLHRWEKLVDASDQWSDWTPLGKNVQPYPAVRENEDGNLEVFAMDATNSNIILHRSQISSASDWLDWSEIDRRTFQYTSRTWQIDEGLPDNLVQAITQTGDGYLWVGTRNGLARFDGEHFTTFDAKNTPEIKNSSITALCADEDGTLWIGTDGGGIVHLKDGAFNHIGRTEGIAGDNVRVIYHDKKGVLWIGTTTGMSRYENGLFTTFTTKNGLSSDSVRFISEDRDGNIWIATGKGLNRLRAGGSMDSFNMPNGLPNDSVRGICQDAGGRIWIGSNNGLLWYNWYWGGHFFAYNTRYGLSDTFVSTICEDRENNLWVGTYSGLNRFRAGRFYNVLDNEGLPFDRVNSLFEDRQGDLWVGTKEGLVRLTPKRFFAYTKQQGLTHNNIMSVLEDHSGSLWIGTWGGGLDELKNEKVTAYAPTNLLSQDLILSLCEGRDGSLWVGADFDGGLTRLKNGTITHYTWKDGLPDAGLRVIHEDKLGNVWIGTSRGLCCLKDGKFTTYTTTNRLAGNEVRAICEDSSGGLWFGTDGGLSRWNNGAFANFTTNNGLSDDAINALYEDSESNLWIGTGSGGLNRYKDGHFTTYRTQQGLFSDEIFEITEDDNRRLWMSCSQGIFWVSKDDLARWDKGTTKFIPCVAYGKSDGMETPQCNGAGKPAAWKSSDGMLWFPTSKGLASVNPKTIAANRTPPAIYIEQLIADKNPQLDRGAAFRETTRPVRIPPGRGDIEFHYTALNLTAPEKSRFKYRLDGIDTDWLDAGPRRVAYYNNVSPGNYHFRVIACNEDGVWNQIGAQLDIIVLPHYWQTWWFESLIVLLVISTASGTALFATRIKMQRKLALLEQRHAIEKERGRIAKDIHDDLGSSLTRIMMLGERAEEELGRPDHVSNHVRKIVMSARHTVQALDEIVWAVNPENDTLDGLLNYIGHYANEFFENSNVQCRFEMPVELPDLPLPAEVRHNLFLVVKESFNNTLKHSGATQVQVFVSVVDDRVQITIGDNGRGFDLGSVSAGNGLVNMRKRIEHIGGNIEITSSQDNGTRTVIAIELRPNRKLR
jgi:ligand-binding sensor domain-containing protein/signal transduction histidine kinase